MIGRYRGYHAALIKTLTKQHGISTRQFRQTLEAALSGLEIEIPRHVPDGYKVLLPEREIHVFEIEVTQPISDAKLMAYAEFCDELAEYEWSVSLFVVNRFGHINEVPLMEWYLKILRDRPSFDGSKDGRYRCS